jgi:hypothetical protein
LEWTEYKISRKTGQGEKRKKKQGKIKELRGADPLRKRMKGLRKVESYRGEGEAKVPN